MSSLLAKFAALAAFCLGLAACAEEPAPNDPPIKAGTHMVVKVSGTHYKSKVTHAEDGYVTWVYYWKNQPVAKFKSYRGLIIVFAEEEGFRRWIDLDKAPIDQIFPLETGKQTTLAGRQYIEKEGSDLPFSATLSVRGRDTVTVGEKRYPVFVIDLSFIEPRAGSELEVVKTMWYSPELELALKTDYLFEGRVFSVSVTSLTCPDGQTDDEPYEPEGLGTIRV